MRYLIVLFCFALASCGATPKKKEVNKSTNVSTSTVEYIRSIKFVSPKKHQTCKLDSKISFDLSIKEKFKTDSVEVFIDGILFKTLKSAPYKFDYTFTNSKVGNRQLKAIAFHDNNKRGLTVTNITLMPSKAPINKGYKVIKTYSHDVNDYTQGLVFHNGYLYEGTGRLNKSCIKKHDLKTGDVISVLDIDKKLFGEGITIYKNKIIQLTWQSGRGFVYDIDSFSKESEFSYSTQGWGITTIGDELVMSDGTNKLYYIDPNSFAVKSQIEVYDEKGPVDQLNELEYINGMIYANVWMTDTIVAIEPSTGVVKQNINMSGLLTKAELKKLVDSDDVLNGIAYDKATKRFFVTGKHWPKLFQIEIK